MDDQELREIVNPVFNLHSKRYLCCEFLISRPDFTKKWEGEDIFIVGHTPTWFLGDKDNRIFKNGNLINIDCVCVMDGHLAALCLETMEEFYVKGC